MNRTCLSFLAMLLLAACAHGAAGKKEKPPEKKRVVIDVRTAGEYEQDHFGGAINIPYNKIRERIGRHVKDKNRKIIVYCASGGRSRVAAETLGDMGYKNVVDAGAFEELMRKENEEEF